MPARIPIPASPILPLDPMAPYISPAIPTYDPIAYPKPTDPTSNPVMVARAASIINREIPNPVVTIDWTWAGVRQALNNHVIGMFDRPAQLWDAVLGDDRVQSVVGSRTAGLFSRPVKHEPAQIRRVKGSRAAQECHDAWIEAWPKIANEAALSNLHRSGIGMGLGVGQLLWDTSGEYAIPHIVPWHLRYTYYQHVWRALLGISLDGLVHIRPGDGHWLVHAPHGLHLGWMQGALRAVATPWIQRQQHRRDLARLSERNGFPLIKLLTPAAGDPKQILPLRQAFSALGQESVVECPQGVDKATSYDMELVEAQADNWQIFIEGIKSCDSAITLAIQFQNLMTEVTGGSFAATQMHGGVRQDAIEFDNRRWIATLYQQVARPFAAINFGDADLATTSSWEITPYEDNKTAAQTFFYIMQGLNQARLAGHKIDDVVAFLRTFDQSTGGATFEHVEPTVVAVQSTKNAAPKEIDDAAA